MITTTTTTKSGDSFIVGTVCENLNWGSFVQKQHKHWHFTELLDNYCWMRSQSRKNICLRRIFILLPIKIDEAKTLNWVKHIYVKMEMSKHRMHSKLSWRLCFHFRFSFSSCHYFCRFRDFHRSLNDDDDDNMGTTRCALSGSGAPIQANKATIALRVQNYIFFELAFRRRQFASIYYF